MLSPDDLQALLDKLHAAGYRLRKVSADGIEVAEAGPSLELSGRDERPNVEALRQAELEEFEQDKFAHVGGRPSFLRRPTAQSSASPWKDDPRDA